MSGEFKDITGQPLEVSIDPDPYREENGEPARVIVQGKEFFLQLSPGTALKVGIEIIKCAWFEKRQK